LDESVIRVEYLEVKCNIKNNNNNTKVD
jgi:hypothetical protein